MKITLVQYIMISILLAIGNIVLGQQNWDNYTLLANYPLNSNTKDALGKQDSITAKNIIINEDGAYSNGIYLGSFPDGCLLETSAVKEINFDDFGISLIFKFDTIYNTEMPIIVAGKLNRYLAVYLNMWQGEAHLALYKNFNFHKIIGDDLLIPDKWYKIDLLHRSDTSYLYLDDQLVAKHIGSLEFNGTKDDKNSKIISNTHSGDGRTFKGYWKDFNIYSKNPTSVHNVQIHRGYIYPNPTEQQINLSLENKQQVKSYQIIDINGRVIRTNTVNQFLNHLNISVDQLDAGIYLLALDTGKSIKKKYKFIKNHL